MAKKSCVPQIRCDHNTKSVHLIFHLKTNRLPLRSCSTPPCGQLEVSEAAGLCVLRSLLYRFSLCEKDCILAEVLTESQDGKYQ